MTLSALVTDFLEYLELERNASQLTIKNYGHYLKRFLDFAHSTSFGYAQDRSSGQAKDKLEVKKRNEKSTSFWSLQELVKQLH